MIPHAPSGRSTEFDSVDYAIMDRGFHDIVSPGCEHDPAALFDLFLERWSPAYAVVFATQEEQHALEQVKTLEQQIIALEARRALLDRVAPHD